MQGMRDLLRSTLGRSLKPLPPLDRLAAAWPVACGSALAGHGEVVAYEKSIVRVIVSSAEWLAPLEHMRRILESDLARIAAVPVTAIHFELKQELKLQPGALPQKPGFRPAKKGSSRRG
jgi:hypothetical protein